MYALAQKPANSAGTQLTGLPHSPELSRRSMLMSDELRAYLFNIIAACVAGPVGTDGKRRRNRQ